jgi:predicted nucleic acid binding AN1-type Zn finger protein
VGAHCALDTCNERDFLPFVCSACQKKYCLAHRTPAQHECGAEPAAKISAASCPLCGAVVSARKGQTLDDAVATHMDGGCQGTDVKAPRCAVANCRNRDILRLKCDGCGVVTCVAHRAPNQHACPSVAATPAVAEKNGNSNNAAPSSASRVANRVRALMSNLHSQHKKPATAMAMKQGAQGDAKIPPERRWYAEVHYGLKVSREATHLQFAICN